jgi:hypothetical protein
MLSFRSGVLSLASVLMIQTAWADPAQPIDPERLKALLPAAWPGMERRNVEAARNNMGGFKSSTAEAHYKAGFNGPGRLELVVRLSDSGESSAKMYIYGADYLKKDVKNDTQKSLTQGGRRFLLTSTTAKSMIIETQVAGRWMVNVNCIEATEAQCVDVLGKVDFAGLDKLKP